jgi:hypothetical protein
MSHDQTGMPLSGGLSEEEYREVMARLEAEYTPEPPEEVARQWDDLIWVRDDPGLQQRFPGKWVAVRDRQVLAVGDEREAVIAAGEKLSGLPHSKLVIAVIPGNDPLDWDPRAFDTSFSD